MQNKVDSQKELIFTARFVLLFASNLIVVSVYFLLMTTMAYYAVFSYGVDSAIAGLTASIFLLGGVVGRIMSGRFGSQMGLKRIAMIAMLVQLFMCLFYFFNSLGIAFLIVVRLIHGISFGIINTVLPAMAVDALPQSRMGEGTGYYMLSNSLGAGLGPLMSVLIAVGIDYVILFSCCTVLSVIATAMMLPVKDRIEPESTESVIIDKIEPVRSDSPISRTLDTSVLKFCVFMFLVAFSYSSITAFVNSYAIELGMGLYAPFIFLVYSVVLIFIRPITGKLMDKHGENVILYPSIISMGVGLLLAAFATNPVMLLACGIFMATGFGTCMSVGQATAIKISKAKDTSKTVSTFFFLCDGGCGIGPFMLGFAVSGFGYQTMYVISAAVALGAALYYHHIHGKKR